MSRTTEAVKRWKVTWEQRKGPYWRAKAESFEKRQQARDRRTALRASSIARYVRIAVGPAISRVIVTGGKGHTRLPNDHSDSWWPGTLQKAVNESGESLVSLADEMGVNPDYLRNWYHGGRPKSKFRKLLKEHLGLDEEDLPDFIPTKNGKPVGYPTKTDKHWLGLWKGYAELLYGATLRNEQWPGTQQRIAGHAARVEAVA